LFVFVIRLLHGYDHSEREIHTQADGVVVPTQSLATDFLQNSATAFFRWGFAQQLAASILLAWLACSVDLHISAWVAESCLDMTQTDL
jgi:hypothetical protein